MRTAMRLVDDPVADIQTYQFAGLAATQRQRGFREDILQLQAEVSALREELVRAERTISQKDVLLRNGIVREMALRMEIAKAIC
jgi:hypothetical protein